MSGDRTLYIKDLNQLEWEACESLDGEEVMMIPA